MNRDAMNGSRYTILIKIQSYDGKQPAGILHVSGDGREYSFDNFTQLVVHIDRLMSTPEKPAVTKEEIFALARRQSRFGLVAGEKKWLPKKERALAEFRMNVYFKKFGAWQGDMTCLDSGRSSAFRSVVEMALMLDFELEQAFAKRQRGEAEA